MKLPNKCLNCGIEYNKDSSDGYLITRSSLDVDGDEPDRIDDQILECSQCHQLYRARWKLESLSMLIEEGLKP